MLSAIFMIFEKAGIEMIDMVPTMVEASRPLRT
jgi:hypothetical protein